MAAFPFITDAERKQQREAARIAAEWEHTATSAAVRTLCWPALAATSYFIGPLRIFSESRHDLWPSIAMGLMTSIYMSIIVGCVIGSIAYCIAQSMGRSATIKTAIVMALIFDFTLWGWAVVLMYPKN
ncbi:MAG TPA: hypothetical protein VGM98_16340 [Schlesneria sp.]|jgi:hypothetical protein